MTKQSPARTITYEIFHAHGDFFWTSLRYGYGELSAQQIRQSFDKGLYRFEGTLTLPALDVRDELEQVFEITNRGNWGRSDSRSTSVGDVVRVGHQYWIVAPKGFDSGWQDD